ncbi:MAG: hypothetical protein ABSG57_14415, partial [Candidatus Bathyarchaeia archaeon]
HSRPAMAGGIQSDDSTFPKVCGVDSSRHCGTGMTRSRKCHIALMNLGRSFSIKHTTPLKSLRGFANLKLAPDAGKCYFVSFRPTLRLDKFLPNS